MPMSPEKFKVAVETQIAAIFRESSTKGLSPTASADMDRFVDTLVPLLRRRVNWTRVVIAREPEHFREYAQRQLREGWNVEKHRRAAAGGQAQLDDKSVQTATNEQRVTAAAARKRRQEDAVLARERAENRAESKRKSADRAAQKLRDAVRNRPAPMPGPLPYGVSHRGAELIVAEWMRFLGVLDAEATRFSADGGIDVTSETVVAQVKNYTGTVPVEDVRAMFGVAVALKLTPWFFTSGYFTTEAIKFAERVEMPCFHYSPERGGLEALNEPALRIFAAILPSVCETPHFIGPYLSD
jgi:hypothetical protein